MQGCSENWKTAAVRRKTKLLKQKKATKCRNNSVVIICYLKILRLMVINAVIRTGVTFNPSQEFKKTVRKKQES